MIITETYSRIRAALIEVGRNEGLRPFEARLLVALDERGGDGRYAALADDLIVDGSAVRRAVIMLRDTGYVTTPGRLRSPSWASVETVVHLTDKGHAIAAAVVELAQ